MKEAVRFLTGAVNYEVLEQDLHVNPSRMPAIPKSRFVISNMRRTLPGDACM